VGDRDREVISMWALGVIASVAAVAALARYFVGRDNLPPMERHIRALAALRDLAQQPRPAVAEALPPDVPTDHVRILADVPDDERRARRAPVRRSTAKPAWATDLPAIAIRPAGERRVPSAVPAGEPSRVGDQARADGPPRGDEQVASVVVPASIAPAPVTAAPVISPLIAPAHARRGLGFAGPRSRISAAVAAAAVVVLIGTLVAIGVNGRGTEGAAAPKAPALGAVPVGATVTSTSASTSSTTAPRAAPTVTRTTDGATVSLAAPFVLTLRTTQLCWIRITDTAGAELFTDTLPAGHTQQIPGAGPIVLRVGNMAGLTISVDGVDLALGGLARTANITFQTT
jgi:hypothetical protein